MADVFISYARADQASAARVAKGLQAAGFDVWWDADLPAHRSYSEVIERNLEEARAVVVLWSKDAAASQWVRAEADVARNAGKLVQAQLDAALPPLPFNQVQCAVLKGWRGGAGHAGWAKLQASVAELVSGQAGPTKSAKLPLWDRLQANRWSVAAVLSLIVCAFALFLYLERPGSGPKPVLAVLPFNSLDQRDASLAAGMWEDTRQAIGRNPQLLVLGPNTSEELAKKDSGATRKAADYLLNASIRTFGDRIRISTDLTRTKDGAQVWSDTFDRKLDDVFQLQSDIAQQIEGHIRGRLAQGGGQLPQNIATSGEVYALYSDARAKIRKRDERLYKPAVVQLQQVVRMDPNFAPGWATLAVMKQFGITGGKISGATAEQDARRAVALAPNLGTAHAALGLVLGEGPAAEAELRRAVELDPSDIEAMNWLAGVIDNSRAQEKLALYSRIIDMEPLWWPAILNKLNLLYRLGRMPAMEQELARVEKLGDTALANIVKLDILSRKGDLSAVVDLGAKEYRRDPMGAGSAYLWGALIQLGFFDIADKLSPPPEGFIPLIRANSPRAMDAVEKQMTAKEFWRYGPLPVVIGRVCLLTDRMTWLTKMFNSAVTSPDDFEQLVGKDRMPEIAPALAVSLRQTGDAAAAMKLLQLAEADYGGRDSDSPGEQIVLVRIYAAQGRIDDAVKLLSAAVASGWLPSYLPYDIDLEHDPAFNELRMDPRFQQARQQILATIARERSEVNVAALAQLKPAGG